MIVFGLISILQGQMSVPGGDTIFLNPNGPSIKLKSLLDGIVDKVQYQLETVLTNDLHHIPSSGNLLHSESNYNLADEFSNQSNPSNTNLHSLNPEKEDYNQNNPMNLNNDKVIQVMSILKTTRKLLCIGLTTTRYSFQYREQIKALENANGLCTNFEKDTHPHSTSALLILEEFFFLHNLILNRESQSQRYNLNHALNILQSDIHIPNFAKVIANEGIERSFEKIDAKKLNEKNQNEERGKIPLNEQARYNIDIEEINHQLRLTILNIKLHERRLFSSSSFSSTRKSNINNIEYFAGSHSVFTKSMNISIQNGLLTLREPHCFTLTYTFNPEVLISMLHEVSFDENDERTLICPLILLKVVFERPLGINVEVFPLPTSYDEKNIIRMVNDRMELIYSSYNNNKKSTKEDSGESMNLEKRFKGEKEDVEMDLVFKAFSNAYGLIKWFSFRLQLDSMRLQSISLIHKNDHLASVGKNFGSKCPFKNQSKVWRRAELKAFSGAVMVNDKVFEHRRNIDLLGKENIIPTKRGSVDIIEHDIHSITIRQIQINAWNPALLKYYWDEKNDLFELRFWNNRAIFHAYINPNVSMNSISNSSLRQRHGIPNGEKNATNMLKHQIGNINNLITGIIRIEIIFVKEKESDKNVDWQTETVKMPQNTMRPLLKLTTGFEMENENYFNRAEQIYETRATFHQHEVSYIDANGYRIANQSSSSSNVEVPTEHNSNSANFPSIEILLKENILGLMNWKLEVIVKLLNSIFENFNCKNIVNISTLESRKGPSSIVSIYGSPFFFVSIDIYRGILLLIPMSPLQRGIKEGLSMESLGLEDDIFDILDDCAIEWNRLLHHFLVTKYHYESGKKQVTNTINTDFHDDENMELIVDGNERLTPEIYIRDHFSTFQLDRLQDTFHNLICFCVQVLIHEHFCISSGVNLDGLTNTCGINNYRLISHLELFTRVRRSNNFRQQVYNKLSKQSMKTTDDQTAKGLVSEDQLNTSVSASKLPFTTFFTIKNIEEWNSSYPIFSVQITRHQNQNKSSGATSFTSYSNLLIIISILGYGSICQSFLPLEKFRLNSDFKHDVIGKKGTYKILQNSDLFVEMENIFKQLEVFAQLDSLSRVHKLVFVDGKAYSDFNILLQRPGNLTDTRSFNQFSGFDIERFYNGEPIEFAVGGPSPTASSSSMGIVEANIINVTISFDKSKFSWNIFFVLADDGEISKLTKKLKYSSLSVYPKSQDANFSLNQNEIISEDDNYIHLEFGIDSETGLLKNLIFTPPKFNYLPSKERGIWTENLSKKNSNFDGGFIIFYVTSIILDYYNKDFMRTKKNEGTVPSFSLLAASYDPNYLLLKYENDFLLKMATLEMGILQSEEQAASGFDETINTRRTWKIHDKIIELFTQEKIDKGENMLSKSTTGIRKLKNFWQLYVNVPSHFKFYRKFHHLLSDVGKLENFQPENVIEISQAKILLLQDIFELLNDKAFYEKDIVDRTMNGNIGLEVTINDTQNKIPLLLFTNDTWDKELSFSSWSFSIVQITFRRGKGSGIFLHLRPGKNDNDYCVKYSFYGLNTVIKQNDLPSDHLKASEMTRALFLSNFRNIMLYLNSHFLLSYGKSQ